MALTDRGAIALRIERTRTQAALRCSVPGCERATMGASGGLAAFHCRYHVQFKARHGSHWCSTYRAADLRPYLTSASKWLSMHRSDALVVATVAWTRGLLDSAGPVMDAQSIRRKPAKDRAMIALARLREAAVAPERILALHFAVSALIDDDLGSHRSDEFRIVQVAKGLHRLASGTHRRWDFPSADGRMLPIRLEAYPKSSGLVLRVIGGKIDELCSMLTDRHLQDIRDLKAQIYGPHPSRLPGWRPDWQLKRQLAG